MKVAGNKIKNLKLFDGTRAEFVTQQHQLHSKRGAIAAIKTLSTGKSSNEAAKFPLKLVRKLWPSGCKGDF